MRRTPFERRLRDRLHGARPPRAVEAEERAWHVVKAAHAERLPARGRRRRGRVALALAGAAAIAVLALSPAGAKVGDWIGDVVTPAPEPTRSGLGSLPSAGRLLVDADGGPWVVRDDGSKRSLGDLGDATWSPGGLFVAAADGHELVALEPDGDVRWTRPVPGPVAVPRWSPDGFRIAYRGGRDLYVAIADNSANWALASNVRPAAPAWQPDRAPGHQVVAFATGARIRIVAVDERRALGVTAPGPVPRELWWSGRRLVAVSRGEVRIHTQSGRLLRRLRLPRSRRAEGSALDPAGRRLAVAAARPDGLASELLLFRLDRRGAPGARRPFAGPGSIEGLTWSIDGRLLVVGLPRADQWVFLRPRGGPLEVVSGIRDQFDGGGRGRAAGGRPGAFPRPAGWCYADPPAPGAARFPPCSTGAAPSVDVP